MCAPLRGYVAYEESDKRLRRQSGFNGSLSYGRGFPCKGYPQFFQLSRLVQVPLQITDGGLAGASSQGSQASGQTSRGSHLGYTGHDVHFVPNESF